MFKYIILSSLFTTTILAGIIEHHEPYKAEEGETEIHHEIDHKHAQSHQSLKFHHFHPVPVYIKKEDQEFLKHPVEIGDSKQKLKLIHPETEKHHGYGAVLENHAESKFHHHGGGDYEHYEHHEHYGHE